MVFFVTNNTQKGKTKKATFILGSSREVNSPTRLKNKNLQLQIVVENGNFNKICSTDTIT
jgi:hypothetical protein